MKLKSFWILFFTFIENQLDGDKDTVTVTVRLKDNTTEITSESSLSPQNDLDKNTNEKPYGKEITKLNITANGLLESEEIMNVQNAQDSSMCKLANSDQTQTIVSVDTDTDTDKVNVHSTNEQMEQSLSQCHKDEGEGEGENSTEMTDNQNLKDGSKYNLVLSMLCCCCTQHTVDMRL